MSRYSLSLRGLDLAWLRRSTATSLEERLSRRVARGRQELPVPELRASGKQVSSPGGREGIGLVTFVTDIYIPHVLCHFHLVFQYLRAGLSVEFLLHLNSV